MNSIKFNILIEIMRKFVIIACIIVSIYAKPFPSIDDNSLDEDDASLIDLSHYGSSIFGVPSNETGKRVASYDPETSDLNPEELGEYLEGDMLMPPDFARNGLIATTSHWPGGIVPFEISGYFGMFLFCFVLCVLESHCNQLVV